jgi:hypothetical protein
MKSINLLLKSQDIQNELEPESITDIYGYMHPFIQEQSKENE